MHISPHISLKNVLKEFHLQTDKTFKDLIPSLIKGGSWSQKHVVFNSLSLEIKSGEAVGLVGINGAGKSTIMKLIAGVTYPTKGRIRIQGRVAPLIELGAGFHHELSGYENIFLNAAILGMHKKEIELVLDKIIDFCEIENDYLHSPIKHYSTGMVMRLAFSIAVHAIADIYLIDEVLAVGDKRFQAKCLRKMHQLKNQKNKIVIFVSHSEKDIKKFCDRAIVIHRGEVLADSNPDKVYQVYNKLS